jgi:hypothetical protein
MTDVRVAPGGVFKNCCLDSGRFDGVARDYYRRG